MPHPRAQHYRAPRHLLAALIICAPAMLHAHPADVSHLRVDVLPSAVDIRCTLNLVTVAKLAPLDANRDGSITFTEIEACAPVVAEFLTKQTLVAVNDADASLGTYSKLDCVWPNPKATPVLLPELAGHFVDYQFHLPWTKPVSDVWLGFQWFDALGDLHTIQGIFHQPGQHDTPVDFSVSEPEFLFVAATEEPSAPSPDGPKSKTWAAMFVVAACIGFGVTAWLRRYSRKITVLP